MNEAVEKKYIITPEQDINFVRKILQRTGNIRLVRDLELKQGSSLITTKEELTSQDLENILSKPETIKKLKLPLSTCIAMPSAITEDILRKNYFAVIKYFKDRKICNFENIQETVGDIISQLLNSDLDPITLTSLELLKNPPNQLDLFRSSLVSAMLATQLRKEDNEFNDRDLANLFYVGLFQETGKFFLDTIGSFGHLGHDQHPILSASIIEGGNFSPDVIAAIKSHHKYLNTQGFPKNAEFPNAYAQTIQISNQFMIGLGKGGLEYALGKLDKMSQGDNAALNSRLVAMLIDMFPNISREKFNFFKEVGYYVASYELMLDKINGEVRHNLSLITGAKNFTSLLSSTQESIYRYEEELEDLRQALNAKISNISLRVKNIDINLVRTSKKGEVYQSILKLSRIAEDIVSARPILKDYILNPIKTLKLKLEELS